MAETIPLDPTARADNPSVDLTRGDRTHEVLPDLAYQRLAVVNVAYYGAANAPDRTWVLIDAGVIGSTGAIVRAVEERFGEDSRPYAIVMTHGHFDHVGALKELATRWEAPVYAHELELPYLNGSASYPPPDPGVGGGWMSILSPLFPRNPVNVSQWLKPLSNDGSVPGMPGWRWLHTPGHTPGHLSLWRETDRTVIVGDAFVTTRQESAYASAVQKAEMHGPPMYFTIDWELARESVQRLAALEPELAICGHGRAMQGPAMRQALHALADQFDQVAVPKDGKYVAAPARASDGSAYHPTS